MELVICYGYVCLFCAALPLTPIIAVFSVWCELKVDGYKFTNFIQRPFPAGASDIGIWEHILGFMTIMTTITNIGIVFFTDNRFELDSTSQWVLFVGIEHLALLSIWLIREAIPDLDEETEDIIKRHEFVRKYKYYNLEPEADEAEKEAKKIKGGVLKIIK